MSIEGSRHHGISDVRRSLSFGSVPLEGADTVIGNGGTSCTTADQIPAEVQLQNECESMWKELNNTQARLEARPRNHAFETVGEEYEGPKVLEMVLRAKEKKLQTELLALENKGLEVLSTNPEFIQTFLQDQLVNSIKQLEETLQVIKGQRQQLQCEINQEEEIIDQHKKVRSSLQNKIAALKEEKENAHGFTSELYDLERKKKAAEKYLKTTMKQLGSFLAENFPPPSSNDMKGKQPSKVALDPNTRYVSLQQLTEDLMNLWYSSPHDPYLDIKRSHWPPYLELLLRSGVAQRHPQDCNRIKLVAFNH